eukprot:689000_1
MLYSRSRWLLQPTRLSYSRMFSLKTRPLETIPPKFGTNIDRILPKDEILSQKELRSLAIRHPEVAAEFHPTKNGDLSATQIPSWYKVPVWWQCRDDKHEWKACPHNRTSRGDGCPFCSGHRVTSKNSLATGCPFCSGTRVTDKNSLAIQKPKIATEAQGCRAELHPSKNGALSSVDLHVSSSKKVWWRCATDPEHEWQARPDNRTCDKGTGCPFCSGTRVTDKNSLAIQKPKIAAELHPSKNGALSSVDLH